MIFLFPLFSPNRKQNFIGGAEGVEIQHAVYMKRGLKYTACFLGQENKVILQIV